VILLIVSQPDVNAKKHNAARREKKRTFIISSPKKSEKC